MTTDEVEALTASTRRNAALVELRASRAAERAASERHRQAIADWIAATCGHHETIEGRRTGRWCTEAPGHLDDHENLNGDRWAS